MKFPSELDNRGRIERIAQATRASFGVAFWGDTSTSLVDEICIGAASGVNLNCILLRGLPRRSFNTPRFR
jgi:hypothetical protein